MADPCNVQFTFNYVNLITFLMYSYDTVTILNLLNNTLYKCVNEKAKNISVKVLLRLENLIFIK